MSWLRKSEASQTAQSGKSPFKPAPKETASKEKTDETKTASHVPPEPKPPENSPVEPEKKTEQAVAAAETKASTDPPKPPDTAPVSVHDAETLALINEELALASPEERDKLFAEWKSLDGAMVRQVIRIRKMVRDLEASSLAATAVAATATSTPPEASTNSSPASSTPPQPVNLPGAANPWNSAAASSESRVLALGPQSSTPPEIEQVAQVQPAAHNAVATGPSNAVSDCGHSATRPVPVLEALATTGPAGVSANGTSVQPPASVSTADSSGAWIGQLRQLISAAESRAEQARGAFLNQSATPGDDTIRKQYVESQVHLRLLYLMAGEQARAMQAIPGLEAADQEFWQQVIWGVANYFDSGALPNRSDRVTQTIEQLRTAVARLQGEANLQLRNVAFCHKITSFGNFERFERDEYTPGQKVLLYAEVVNFKSTPQATDGLYKTQLKSTIEIFRAGQGQPVKKIDFDPTVDLCRSYRQDYFHSYELKIPPDLTLGPHVLKLTVEDIQSGKLATYSVNFAVK